jgi:hypothetical protein
MNSEKMEMPVKQKEELLNTLKTRFEKKPEPAIRIPSGMKYRKGWSLILQNYGR